MTALNEDSARVELLKKLISGWLRQSKYRARKANLEVNVEYQDIIKIYEDFKYLCAYCDAPAGSPDHPFPLKDKGLCIQANIVPCCDLCRAKKKSRTIIKFYQEEHITERKFSDLIKLLVRYKGGDKIRDHIKAIYAAAKQAT